jgi:oxygen-independent coproporphyrinogen-3 oxidase
MAGIYLHVPFCKQACTYCNFHFSTSSKLKPEIVKAMMAELRMQRNFLEGQEIRTIYFGGGTPSLLSADEINKLFDVISENYLVTDAPEFTLEANPDDLDSAYIKELKTTPVNRFSIGIQSFLDSDLNYMHRVHNAQQADYAIKAAQDTGFTNLTIDLIYGTPGLSDMQWKQNLRKVKEYNIPHFSAYALTVEEGTALHHAILKKRSSPVDAEQAAQQFEILMEEAEQMGYEHYEISNLAANQAYARHNTNYWKGIPYLGIGPSAHSFNGIARRWNIANNALYAQSILQEHKLNYEEEALTQTQRLNEYIMTSLRTKWGCDLERIAAEWDSSYSAEIEKSSLAFEERNWLKKNEKKLVLTNKGKLFADKIAAELFIS